MIRSRQLVLASVLLVGACGDDGGNNNNDCGAAEVPYNGVDDDCDATTPDDDLDGDGYAQAEDCDDAAAAVNPGATEVPYNGVDDDCDAATAEDDVDGDGVTMATDCDDSDATRYPGAVDVGWDGVDTDCDGLDVGASSALPKVVAELGAPLAALSDVRLVVGATHALVVGFDATTDMIVGKLVSLADGTTTDVSIAAAEAAKDIRALVAFPRGAGFGIAYNLQNHAASAAWCHVYAQTVAITGTAGTAVQITATTAGNVQSASFCPRAPLGIQAGTNDWVFFMQPQGITQGNAGENAQVVRRTLDLTTGAGTLSDPSVNGVNQSNAGGYLLDASYNGDLVGLAYTYTFNNITKILFWNDAGIVGINGGASIYGGEHEVFAEPRTPVRIESTAFDGSGDASFVLVRAVNNASDRTAVRRAVTLTKDMTTYTSTLDAEYAVATSALAGNVGLARSASDYRIAWCDGGYLQGARLTNPVATTSPLTARALDPTRSGVDVKLVDSRQNTTRLAHLLDVDDPVASNRKLVLVIESL